MERAVRFLAHKDMLDGANTAIDRRHIPGTGEIRALFMNANSWIF
jgi:hypothetical protein